MKKTTFILIVMSFFAATGQRKKKGEERMIPQTQEDSVKFEGILVEAEKQLIIENHEKALEGFMKALEMNNQSAAVNFKISEALRKRNKGQEAVPYALRAVELAKDNKFYLLALARLYQSIGFFIDASRIYEELILQYPSDEPGLYELAELYQNIGYKKEMFETFDKIEKQFGVKVEIVRERQRILMKEQDIDGVIAEYQKLINEYPNDLSHRKDLIDFLIQNKRLDEAKSEIAAYEQEESVNSEILLLKSEIARMSNDRRQALDLLGSAFEVSAIDFESKFRILSNYLTKKLNDGENGRMAEISKKLATKHPDEYKAFAFAGDILLRNGEKKEALSYYLKAARINPANFSVWQNIINLENKLNLNDSVIVHAEEALEYFPNQAVLYYYAGAGYLINNEHKKSVHRLEQGKKYTIDPDLLAVFYGHLGDAYNGLKEYEKVGHVLRKSAGKPTRKCSCVE